MAFKFRGTPFPPCPSGFEDHIDKDEHGVRIPLRVWRAAGSVHRAPWVMWMHGGGFIAGKFTAANAWVVPGFTSRGYHVVFIAYRFMPQASLSDIVQDCKDAFKWCQSNLPGILGDDTIDIDRYVTAGDSAGGYICAQLPFELNPPPSAVVPVHGLVDFYSSVMKDKGPRSASRTQYHRPRTEEELLAAANDHDLAHAEFFCPWDGDLPPNIEIERTRAFLGVSDYEVTDRHLLRLDLNKYLVATGFDRIAALFRRKDQVCIGPGIRSRSQVAIPLYELDNVDSYPPTFFLHGTRDSVVHVSQADAMARKLTNMGIPTGHAYDAEGEHCFDIFISGPDDDGWAESIVPALDFVDKHVKRAK